MNGRRSWFVLVGGVLLLTGTAALARSGGGDISTGVIAEKLLGGFLKTLLVALLSIGLGFALAIPGGLLLHAGRGPARVVVRGLVDFIRGTPVIVQLYLVYYGLPGSLGLSIGPLTAAVLTLTVNSAAYMAEVVRSGLMAVGPDQKMAARALGLSRFQVFRLVVWPQAFRVAIPPLMNSAIALLKDTALVSVITVPEVLMEAQNVISVTFDPMPVYLAVAGLFFVFTYPLMLLAGRLERRIKERGFADA
jgi:cystine transport system permease protein